MLHDNAEIGRIKHEVDLIRLIQDSGVALRKVGAEMKGLCLFHRDEHHPSLSVSPARQLWRCFTCGAGGDCFTWVMRRDHVGFAKAKTTLISYLGGRPTLPPCVPRRVPSAMTRPDRDSRDEELVRMAVHGYNARLHRSPQAHAYLASRGLGDRALLDRFLVGFAGPGLAVGMAAEEEDMRARLVRVGLLRANGRHHFQGCITVPVFTEDGHVVNICGRRLPPEGGLSRYLNLPRRRPGVWNWPALTLGQDVIVCEGVLDGLTFDAAGFPNVTACLGVDDFGVNHVAAFKRHGVRRALIAFDRDEAGDRGAARAAAMLQGIGVGCYRVALPRGMDVNAYARQMSPPRKALDLVLRAARRMGPAPSPVRRMVLPSVRPDATTAPAAEARA